MKKLFRFICFMLALSIMFTSVLPYICFAEEGFAGLSSNELLWIENFEECTITPEGSQYSNSSVWAVQNRGNYSLKIEEDERNNSQKVLHISGDDSPDNLVRAINYQSRSFNSEGAIAISFDIMRGANDTFQIQMGPQTNGKCQIQLRIKSGGGICYAYNKVAGGWAWSSDIGSLPEGQWHTITVIAAEGDDDYWALYLDRQKLTEQTSFFGNNNSNINDFRIYVPQDGNASTSGVHQVSNTYLDNIEVKSYYAAFTEDALSVEIGDNIDMHELLQSNVDFVDVLCWNSSDTSIATISSNGILTGLSCGTPTISAQTIDGLTISKTVIIVPADDNGFLWGEDFESCSISDNHEQYLDSDIWQIQNAGSYWVSVYDDPRNTTGKALHISNSDSTDISKSAVQYQSKPFSCEGLTAFSVDINRGENDTFQIQLGPQTSGKCQIQLRIKAGGGICYAYNTSSGWSWSGDVGTMSANQWHNLCIITSSGDTNYWALYLDGEKLTEQPSYFGNNDRSVSDIRIYVAQSSDFAVTNTWIDNLAISHYKPIESVSIDGSTYELETNDTVQLLSTVYPENAFPNLLCWSTSDANIAEVDPNGLVTGIASGEATITAIAPSGVSANVQIVVTGTPQLLIWEENFEDCDEGTTGGFVVQNTTPNQGSIIVEDGLPADAIGKTLTLRRTAGTPIGLSAYYELPSGIDRAVLEYEVCDMVGTHANMVLPTLSSNANGTGSYVTLFEGTGTLYYNAGSNVSTKTLSTGEWHKVKLIVDTVIDKWQLFLDDAFIASGNRFRDGAEGRVKFIFFRAAVENQNVDDGIWYDNFKVSVYSPVETAEFIDNDLSLHGCESRCISVAKNPEYSNDQLVFYSSDNTVATIDPSGIIHGVGVGNATIYLKCHDSIMDSIQVSVLDKAVEEISVNVSSIGLPIGGHEKIVASIYPENSIPNRAEYTSSDASVAYVDEWGEITAVGTGLATISISAGGETAQVAVSVFEPTICKQIYVSPSGSDYAPGTESNPVNITGALRLISENNQNMTGNIEVILTDGYYYLPEKLELTEMYGGSNHYSVIWKAADAATPIIGGGVRINGTEFSDIDHDGVYTFDLSELDSQIADDRASTTRQLFVDGIRAVRARSKTGLTNATYLTVDNRNAGHICDDIVLASFARPQDLEFVYKELWSNPRCGVSSICMNSDSKVEIVMDQPGWSFASNKSASSAGSDGPVYYENALELLDEPGEWYINDDSKVLYYMPRVWEDMEEVVFTIPIIDGELLTISGSDYEHMVHNICFRGITFADTTWTRPSTTSGHSDTQNNHIREGGDTLPDAAIVVSKANGVCFEECTFTRLGITAVKMIEGVQNSHFIGNHFYDISGGAINIGDPLWMNNDVVNPTDIRKIMKNCDVMNNYIHDVAVDYLSAAAVSLSWGADMDFCHNEIFNIPYSGFHIGYGWNIDFDNVLKNLTISNNFVHDFMGEGVSDGGGIYTIGNSSRDGYNVISGNYIKNVLDNSGPLYCDNGSTYYELFNNLVDLSDVKEWAGGDVPLSWMQLNSGADHIIVRDNHTTIDNYNNNTGSDSVIVSNTIIENALDWSHEAQSIIENAGLQHNYGAIRCGYVEKVITNIQDYLDLSENEEFSISVSCLDGKGNLIPGGADSVFYSTSDSSVATVNSSGIVIGQTAGTAVIKISVLSNGIIKEIEKTVYVSDQIAEIYVADFEESGEITISMAAECKHLSIHAETLYGRMFAVDPQYVSFNVTDHSIASISTDGVLTPISTGTTTVGIDVNMNGLVGYTEYTISILQSKEFVECNDMEFFDSDSNWFVSQAGQTFVVDEEDGITSQISSGYATYSGCKYSDELLCFKISINGGSGGWPSIVLRAQDTSSYVGSRTSGYIISFGNGGLQVQRFNASTRTVLFGNVNGHQPESGVISIASPIINNGDEHMVKVGALSDGDSTRLLLIVDNETIIDWVDDSDGAITSPGYFGIVSRNERIVISKVQNNVMD